MDSRPQISMPSPELRFRLHSLLALTAVVAMLAAVAAPYYRAQPSDAQVQLLIYWCALGVFAMFGLWYHWRTVGRLPAAAGSVQLAVASVMRRQSRLPSLLMPALNFVGAIVVAAFMSRMVADDGQGVGNWSAGLPVVMGLNSGLMIGGAIVLFAKTPTYFCDNGLAFFRGFVPWHFIRHAEWSSHSKEEIRFHRLDGDLLITVTPRERGAIEAFVREKTTLLEPTVQAREKPPACAGG